MRRLFWCLAVLSSSVLLGMLPCPSSAGIQPTTPAAIPGGPTAPGIDDENSRARELLIGWKPGVPPAERDRVIASLGGRLVRRLTLVKADTVSFPNVEARDAARSKAANNPAVREVLTNDLPVLQPDYLRAERIDAARRGAGPRADSIRAESGVNLEADPSAPKSLLPNSPPPWSHDNRVEESQEVAKQKQEVIVALISDKDEISDPSLQGMIWENTAEKNGLPGIDDDRNGWIDDIHGIDKISPLQGTEYKAEGLARVVILVADYSLTDPYNPNPQGKVKVMPIKAFIRDYSDYWEDDVSLTTDTALIECLDYAARMGARVVVVQGHHSYQGSALLLDTLRAFPGLIVTASDMLTPTKAWMSILLQNDIGHIIRVGSEVPNGDIWAWYGGRIDLCAHSGIPISSACVVGGVAAHLLSCYPGLSRDQIRDLILGSVDQNIYQFRKSSTGGTLNAARAALGRSSGGCFYVTDLALIDSQGPTANAFSTTYDSKRGILYLFERGEIDYWLWNGRRWRKVKCTMNPDTAPHPPFEDNVYVEYIESRDEIMAVNLKNEWRLKGNVWYHRALPEPSFLEKYYYNDDNSFSFQIKNNNTIYDPVYDRFIHFARDSLSDSPPATGVHFVEYYDGEWRDLYTNSLVPRINVYDIITYNQKIGAVTYFEVHDSNKADRIWEYIDGKWKSRKTNDIYGRYGYYAYDQAGDEFVRLISWGDFGVFSFDGQQWHQRGYEKLSLQGSRIEWAGYSKKFLIIGYLDDRKYLPLSIWQYSGSITPTWIDNLILPQSDYTGDGKADPAVWRPSTGEFLYPGGNLAPERLAGTWGGTPAPGHYCCGDEISYTVCRRAVKGWPRNKPPRTAVKWGAADNSLPFGEFYDIPVPADYDGNGFDDYAVFRKDTGEWFVNHDPDFVGVGGPGDLPVPADYDGDGRAEPATYTPLTSTWHIRGLGDFQFGSPGDSPVPADYDGDGRKDIATWNPRKRLWLVRSWKDGSTQLRVVFGHKWDIPVPGDYDGDGCADIATFTPIQGLWSIRGQEPIHFGRPGDVPLVRGN